MSIKLLNYNKETYEYTYEALNDTTIRAMVNGRGIDCSTQVWDKKKGEVFTAKFPIQ